MGPRGRVERQEHGTTPAPVMGPPQRTRRVGRNSRRRGGCSAVSRRRREVVPSPCQVQLSVGGPPAAVRTVTRSASSVWVHKRCTGIEATTATEAFQTGLGDTKAQVRGVVTERTMLETTRRPGLDPLRPQGRAGSNPPGTSRVGRSRDSTFPRKWRPRWQLLPSQLPLATTTGEQPGGRRKEGGDFRCTGSSVETPIRRRD